LGSLSGEGEVSPGRDQDGAGALEVGARRWRGILRGAPFLWAGWRACTVGVETNCPAWGCGVSRLGVVVARFGRGRVVK
jgi:hypothetical protein